MTIEESTDAPVIEDKPSDIFPEEVLEEIIEHEFLIKVLDENPEKAKAQIRQAVEGYLFGEHSQGMVERVELLHVLDEEAFTSINQKYQNAYGTIEDMYHDIECNPVKIEVLTEAYQKLEAAINAFRLEKTSQSLHNLSFAVSYLEKLKHVNNRPDDVLESLNMVDCDFLDLFQKNINKKDDISFNTYYLWAKKYINLSKLLF